MEYHDENCNNTRMATDSVLDQSDRMYQGRIKLSRQSTIGFSSRIYYRNTEGIPFKWEEEPGKPIEPQTNEALPPLSPPPAFVRLGLPKPNIGIEDNTKAAKKLSLGGLWRQIKRNVNKGNKDINKAIEEVFKRGEIKNSISANKRSIVEKVVETESCGGDDESYLWKFDGEQMRLTPRSSISSSLSSSNSLSSSSSLTSKAPSMEASNYNHPSFTCSPRNIGQIVLCLAKRA